MRSDVNIFIHRDKCYVCGICVERCILDNLRMYLAPCRAACPIHMNCQGYVQMIAQGKEKEAAQEMRKDLPFGGIVGRICTHPCEEKCERRKVDNQAVHLRALKRYLADSYPEIAYEPGIVPSETGKKVVIVGSGPTGLMAAYELAVRGYSITIFDSAAEPGGMMRWGIPSFRLPDQEITKSIDLLEKMGVIFQTGISLGINIELEKLDREWDAIFLAIGAGSSAVLGIPGEDLDSVFPGLGFLRLVREGQTPQIGREIIVIGGGNTAVDTALTCRKLGAENVRVICLEERGQMPAFSSELEEAVEEGIEILNCWGPQKILRQGNGQLEVELSRCLRVFDEQGFFAPELEKICGMRLSADSLIVAVGQRLGDRGVPKELLAESGFKLNADPLTLQTSYPKIFAGGDAVSGPKSAIEAMAQGREAAISIDRMLRGETLKWGRAYWDGTCITEFPIDQSIAIVRPRAKLPHLPISSRKVDSEVEKSMSPADARAESERCLNCGRPGEFNQTCWYCLPCEIECPVDALEVRIPYLVR